MALLDYDCLLGQGGQNGLSKDLRRFTKQLDNGNVSMLKNRAMVDAMTILNGQMKKVICKLHERGPYQPLKSNKQRPEK